MKQEKWLFLWSSIALILGNAGQFVVPYYIGLFVDDMKDGNFDDIPLLCYELVGIILVYLFYCKLFHHIGLIIRSVL